MALKLRLHGHLDRISSAQKIKIYPFRRLGYMLEIELAIAAHKT